MVFRWSAGIPVRWLIVLGVYAVVAALWTANGGRPLDGIDGIGVGQRPCRITVVAPVLNVRSGPADTRAVVTTMTRDTVTNAERVVENGYRMLDRNRWADEDLIEPTSDSDC
ncbi:hypothetical protein [Umezawaea beigongshangensis]|uniref:hypothetical protein n=1 Tax=Umezawaea beigongshangensis TaxID=2780383 RepID=UPI0018F21E9A|nr:hypothetical protein [Umezawaea beigongshangensis]